MQRVITITTHMNIIGKDNKFVENEYPLLTACLADGYNVVLVYPVTAGPSESYRYSLTFVMEKKDETNDDH